MRTIKFDKDYNGKSNSKIFSTIRDEFKGNVYDIVLCKFPERRFKARIINICSIDIKEIDYVSHMLLTIDTGITDYPEILKLFDLIYPNKSLLCFHLLEKI